MKNQIPGSLLDWAEETDYAVTICDINCRIIYMNRRSRETFASHGDIIGKNLLDCHSPASIEKIKKMLSDGSSNVYTISKGGVKKLIFQSPWKINGEIAGLVETSMILPPDMPHYDRDSR
ncbi:MAG: PAS domain-containing protein [Muribaculaceae bacterium]|nr:PAS domain-containing protein [Muribaculaceae bacterium]